MAERVANHFRLKLANLNEVEAHAIKLLPEASARKHGILPLRASDQVVVAATADPMSVHAEQDLQFLSGRRAVFQIAAPGPLQEAIDAAYSRSRIVEFVLQNLAAEVGQTEVEIVHDQTLGSPADSYSDTQPVASLVKRFLRQAASVGAEEVLVEGGVEGGQVKFALGGEPQHFMHLPYPALVRVVRRLKELARLDVTERKRVQVGTIHRLRLGTSLRDAGPYRARAGGRGGPHSTHGPVRPPHILRARPSRAGTRRDTCAPGRRTGFDPGQRRGRPRQIDTADGFQPSPGSEGTGDGGRHGPHRSG